MQSQMYILLWSEIINEFSNKKSRLLCFFYPLKYFILSSENISCILNNLSCCRFKLFESSLILILKIDLISSIISSKSNCVKSVSFGSSLVKYISLLSFFIVVSYITILPSGVNHNSLWVYILQS